MKSYWPQDPAFSTPNNFMRTLPSYINSALINGRRNKYEALHFSTLAASQFFADYANSHLAKGALPINPKRYQPFYAAYSQYEKQNLPHRAANTVLKLIEDRKLPGWIFDMLPLEEVRSSAKDGAGTAECWMKTFEIAIFDPILEGNVLKAPLAVIGGGVTGDLELRILGETKKKVLIEVINEAENNTARTNAQFLIKEVYDV